jgi:4-amino-4-deoxy-L-arabinose transferase-like glycosyltransferase
MIKRTLSLALRLTGLLGLAILFLVPLIWAIFYFGVYLGYGYYKVRGHQEFAKNGIAQIEPASQMNQLFGDCRHYIT